MFRSLTTQAVPSHSHNDSSLDRSLKRLDQDVRRTGRITRRELEDVLEELRHTSMIKKETQKAVKVYKIKDQEYVNKYVCEDGLESLFHEFISLRSYIKPVYYIFRIVVYPKAIFPDKCHVHRDIPLSDQFIDAILEELCAVCVVMPFFLRLSQNIA